MEIREAIYADSWGIEELLMQYQEEVVATNPRIFERDVDRPSITSSMVEQMDRDDVRSVVAVHNDNIIGFARSSKRVHFYTKLIAVDLDMIFIDPEVRLSFLGGRVFSGLFNDFEKWATDIGAKILAISSLSGLEYKKLNETVEKLGYETIGFNSLKRIEVQNG